MDKATWGLVMGLFALVIAMNMVGGDASEEDDTLLRDQVESSIPISAAPTPISTGAPVEELSVEGLPENVEE